MNDGWGFSCEIALRNVTGHHSPINIDKGNDLVPSHYPNQCLPKSMSPYGVIRPQLVNDWIALSGHMSAHLNMTTQYDDDVKWKHFRSYRHYWPQSRHHDVIVMTLQVISYSYLWKNIVVNGYHDINFVEFQGHIRAQAYDTGFTL